MHFSPLLLLFTLLNLLTDSTRVPEMRKVVLNNKVSILFKIPQKGHLFLFSTF